MICAKCGKEIKKEEAHIQKDKPLCEDCLMKSGLFPLGHNGQYKRSFYIKDRQG